MRRERKRKTTRIKRSWRKRSQESGCGEEMNEG